MKLDEMKASFATSDDVVAGECCPATAEGTEDTTWDDEDFYEAIDLLETCKLSIDSVLKHSNVAPGREHYLRNLSDDIQQFVDLFIVKAAGDDAATEGEEAK